MFEVFNFQVEKKPGVLFWNIVSPLRDYTVNSSILFSPTAIVIHSVTTKTPKSRLFDLFNSPFTFNRI